MDLLRVGDLIVLDVDGDSYVSSEGVLDTSVLANTPPASGDHSIVDHVDTNQSAFVLRLQQNYAAENKLRRKLEERGMTRAQAQNAHDSELRALLDDRENEKRINAAEFDFKKGSAVKYGSIVQLQHKVSEKYIMVTRQRIESRDGRKVIIDRNAGQSSWFRIVPSLRVHSEGEPVHLGDRLLFENVESGMMLCAAPSGTTLSREVFGGRQKEATPFRVQVFRTWSDDQQAARCLLGAEPVKLIHKEGEGSLFGDSPPVVSLGLGAAGQGSAEPPTNSACLATGTAEKNSSNAVWAFERADVEPGPGFGQPYVAEGGNTVQWEGGFRIIHVPSGCALAVVGFPNPEAAELASSNLQETSITEEGSEGRDAGSPPAGLARMGSTIPSLNKSASSMGAPMALKGVPFAFVTLVSDQYAAAHVDETLFGIDPQYESAGAAVTLDRYFFLRHLKTGWFVHLATEEETDDYLSAAAAAADEGDAPPKPPPSYGRLLVATAQKYDQDVFGCQRVPHEQLRDIIFVTICAADIVQYLEAFAAATSKAQLSESAFSTFEEVLTELIFFATSETDNTDVLTREGLPRYQQQVLMCEQRVLALCMSCVMAPFHKESPFTADDIRGGHKTLQRVLKISQRLCWHLLRDCTPNRVYASPYVPQLSNLLGYSIGVANTLTEIFTDNDVLLDTIDDTTVSYFLDLIDAPGGRQARYIDFLICLCVSRGKARRRNQWRICRMVVDERPELLLQLSLVGAPKPSTVDPTFGPHHGPEQVVVAPHPSPKGAEYFPAFSRGSMVSDGGEATLCNWLKHTTAATKAYFNRCMDLIAALCAGRNSMNTPKLRKLLPYELAMTIVRHDAFPMELRCKMVGVLRDLYVNADPHENVVEVRHIRKWNQIEDEARKASVALTQKASTAAGQTYLQPGPIEGQARFDALIAFIEHFLGPYGFGKGDHDKKEGQVATEVEANEMIVECLQVLYELIRSGFVSINRLRLMCKGLLFMLDGSDDRMGLPGEKEMDRYARKRTVATEGTTGCDTLLIMEAKEWTCKILWLVCTLRLDLRLSLVLSQYGAEFVEGHWSADGAKPKGILMPGGGHRRSSDRRSSAKPDKSYRYPQGPSGRGSTAAVNVRSSTVSEVPDITRSKSKLVGGVELGRPSSIEPPKTALQKQAAAGSAPPPLSPPPSPPPPTTTSEEQVVLSSARADSMSKSGRARTMSLLQVMNGGGSRGTIKTYKELLRDVTGIFSFESEGPIVKILTDLTRYESQGLSFQAISLIVRQFEQRKTLVQAARQVQLLVRSHMIEALTLLEGFVKRLRRLTSNRRLYARELYEAAWLLGEVTIRCYTLDDGGADETASIPQSVAKSALELDTSDDLCLRVVGRVRAAEGATEVTFVEVGFQGTAIDTMMIPPVASTVYLFGHKYRVVSSDVTSKTLQLDRPLKDVPPPTGDETEDAAWLQLETRVVGADHDTQLLLSKLGAAELALTLMGLPIDRKTVRPAERQLRSVLCCSMRLLKAMCNEFPLVQGQMAKHLTAFAALTEAQLLERDVSPTECIIAICEGNRDACTKVPPEMVRDFAKLAGKTHKPRFLRFLNTIMMPSGEETSTIKRNQQLVMSALVDTREALVLFNRPSERELERQAALFPPGHPALLTYKEREQMIDRNDIELQPRGLLVYHVELVAMLASMAFSNRPEDQEIKSFVRDIISLNAVIDHLTEPPLSFDAKPHRTNTLLPLRANFLKMFTSAFVAAASHTLIKPLHNLASSGRLATLLHEMGRVLDAFVERRVAEPCNFGEDVDALKELVFVQDSVLPAMAALFRSEHMAKAAAEEDIAAASEAFAKTVAAYLEATKDNAELEAGRGLCCVILREMKKHKFDVDVDEAVLTTAATVDAADDGGDKGGGGGSTTLSALGTLGALPPSGRADSTAAEGAAADAAGGHQLMPQDTWLDFVDMLEEECDTPTEYRDLVKTFMEDVDTLLMRFKSEKQRKASKLNPNAIHKSLLACVVRKLASGQVAEGATLPADDLQHSLAALTILNEIMSMRGYTPRNRLDADADRAAELAHRQDVMLRLDVPRICMMIASSESLQLCEQGLQLGIYLLQNGNRRIQDAFYGFLSDPRIMHKVQPYDGTSATFLEKMRHMVRLATQEIKEAKFYRQQQQERLAKFEEETDGLSGATRASMLHEINKPFASRSHIMLVLEFLRLMCEGHNTEMQDLMREQVTGSSAAKVDLVSEINNYFEALEADLDDETAVAQATKCVETLTELCQGNVSMENSRILTESKLIDICGRLIQLEHIAEVDDENLNDMRAAITTLLMALLEGTARDAERRMLLRLDVTRLAQIANKLYKGIQELEQEVEEQEDDLAERQEEEAAAAAAKGKVGSGLAKVGGGLAKAGGGLAKAGGGLGKAAFDLAAKLQDKQQELEASRDAGFSLYVLLRHLKDFEEQDHSSHADQGVAGTRVVDVFNEPWFAAARAFYDELVGSCEIINQAGELERVFFCFPKLCLSLTQSKKDHIEWTVDRETPGAQLIQFIEASDELHFEMVHENNLEKWWLWRFAKRRYMLATNSIFALSVIANLCLIWRSQYCVAPTGLYHVWNSYFCSTSAQTAVWEFADGTAHSDVFSDRGLVPSNPTVTGFFQVEAFRNGTRVAPEWEETTSLVLQIACFVVGVLLCISSVIVFVLDSLRHGYPRVNKLVLCWVKERRFFGRTFETYIRTVNHRRVESFDDINKAVVSAPYAHWWWFYPMCALAYANSGQLLFCMASFIASIISLTTSPYWFAFGLLDFASKSPEIRIVGKVLGQNARSIAMTMIFILLIIYIFSVIGYLQFAEWFFYLEEFYTGDDTAIPACTSLLQCFVTVLDDGLRANDIGSYMEPIRSPDVSDPSLSPYWLGMYYLQSLYNLAFWFVVCIILLNVVFGIIIDSFGELRVHRQEVRAKIDNECFICGIDRFTLDTQGGGFEKHTAEDHQKWNYLFMMVMLREKDPSEYNGWEQHVAKQITPDAQGSVSSSFMPRNIALSLKEHKEREEAETNRRADEAKETYEMVKSLCDEEGLLATIIARQDEMDKKLVKMSEMGMSERSLQRTPGGRGSSKALGLNRGQSSAMISPR